MKNLRLTSGLASLCLSLACLAGTLAHAQERDDYGFFRPVFGTGLWRANINIGGNPPDIDGTTGDFDLVGTFGNSSPDDIALMGDVNGDGVDDRVIYNSGTHQWIWDSAPIVGDQVSGGFGDGVAEGAASAFGQAADIPLLGDINGDGAADRVLFRPADKTWHVDFSITPSMPYNPATHGFGDGVAETMGGSAFYDGGVATIHHVALADYNGDGIADRLVFSAGGFWRSLNPGGASWSDGTDNDSVGVGLGNASFIPPSFVGDFDGDGISDNVAWNGIGNSTVYTRLSSTVPAWSDSVTVLGNHYGDPNQDVHFFMGNLDHAATTLPVELSDFAAE